MTGVWAVLFIASVVHVHESWERGHNDQADIWQAYPDASICQISICLNGVTVDLYIFLGSFAKLRKVTAGFVKCVRPHGNGRIFTKFDIWVFFEKWSRKLKVR